MIYDGWATDDTEVTEDHEVIFHLPMTPMTLIILSHHRVARSSTESFLFLICGLHGMFSST